MIDYPDFSCYDIARYGKIQYDDPFIVVSSGAVVHPAAAIYGPGYIYTLRIYVENKLGAEDVRIDIVLDAVDVFQNTFKELMQQGAWQPGGGFVYLSQYAPPYGDFGLLLSLPTTFNEVLGVSARHTIGSDVTVKIRFQWAKVE